MWKIIGGIIGASWLVMLAAPGVLAVEKQTAIPDMLSVIHSRKSVRHYQDKAVEKSQLEILMKAGMAAPTAADKRPWAFVAITSREKLNALADKLPHGGMLKTAAAAIVVCGIPAKSMPGKESQYWIQDCSAASENILLAAEAIGLGAVWLGSYPVEERVNAIRQSVGLPKEVVPLNVISIGYPKGDEKPKDKFDPKNIHWEQW